MIFWSGIPDLFGMRIRTDRFLNTILEATKLWLKVINWYLSNLSIKKKQSCGSGPFSAGSRSWKSEIWQPDPDPTCTNLESIQACKFFRSIRFLQIFEKNCKIYLKSVESLIFFKMLIQCLYNFTKQGQDPDPDSVNNFRIRNPGNKRFSFLLSVRSRMKIHWLFSHLHSTILLFSSFNSCHEKRASTYLPGWTIE